MSDCFAGFALAADEPVRVELLRAGTNESRLNVASWTTHPFSVVGYAKRGAFEVEVADGPRYRVGRGGAYLIPSGAAIRTRALEPGLGEYVWSHVNVHLASGVELLSLMRLTRAVPAGKAGGRAIERINLGYAQWLAGRGMSGEGARSLREAVVLQRLGMEMLELLMAHAQPTAQASAVLGAHSRLRPVLEYVQAHLAEPMSRGQLARVARLSESRFHVVFSDAMGMAPLAYVTQARLRRAQAMLMQTDQPVAQVGQACGYPDAFHFSRHFKQHVGVSPSAYRDQQRRRWARGL